MRFSISISCLFAAAFVILGIQADDTERWKKEREHFRMGLKVKNDRGDLVDVKLSSTPNPNGRTFGTEVKFWLYGNGQAPVAAGVEIRDDNLNENSLTSYDKTKPTVFVTHGYINSKDSPACVQVRDAYLKHGGFNVIVVDWSSGSFSLYDESAWQVYTVGDKIAAMIRRLDEAGYLKIDETILVGHSLGAHVMGSAGFNLRGRVKAIFGLDPALPLFMFAPIGQRLTKHDAKYVEIIHSNPGFLGVDEYLGDIDFFLNGLPTQKGCGLDLGFACSHSRAYEVYAESINTKIGFVGANCTTNAEFLVNMCLGDRSVYMGGPEVAPGENGVVIIETNPCAPYALGPEYSASHSC